MSDKESSYSGEDDETEEFFEVDKIVDHKVEGRKTFYKVRWKGYAPSQDTWEPQDHLGEGCDEIIGAYFEWRAENARNKQKKKLAATEALSRADAKGAKGHKQASASSSTSSARTSVSMDSSTSSADVSIHSNRSSPGKKESSDDCRIISPSCPHQTSYGSPLTTEYETLTRRCEVRQQSADKVTDSRRCITVLMSQLCDPTQKDLSSVLRQLQACMRKWGRASKDGLDGIDISLITAILISPEDDVLAKRPQYKDYINKAIPGNWTPLHFAAALHKFKICDWLLEQGGWPDIITINRETPLILALRNAAPKKDADRIILFVNKLISVGVNVSHTDHAGRLPSALAKKSKYPAIAALLLKQVQRLRSQTTSAMTSQLSTQPDGLFLKDYFLEPQLLTQPPRITYTIKFKFKAPIVPAVARLTAAYVYPTKTISKGQDLSTIPVNLTTEGTFPFRTLTLNGHDIKPQNKRSMSLTLRSELVVGSNVLEVEMADRSSEQPSDSVIIFGCLIAKSSTS